MKWGLKKVPTLGTSFGRQQAGVCASPRFGCQSHQQQHQGVFGVEGQTYDAISFFGCASKPFRKKAGF